MNDYQLIYHKGYITTDSFGTVWDLRNWWEIKFSYPTYDHSCSFKTFKEDVEKYGIKPQGFTKEECLKIIKDNGDKL